MTDKLKAAFDGIHAEEGLKSDTIRFLQSEMRKRSLRRRRTVPLAAVWASVAMVLLFSCAFYYSPSAYVDVDVNPAIELRLNRFDRVVGLHAYNNDGAQILAGLSLKHRDYRDALARLIGALHQGGYIQNDELVTVTLQADNTGRESALLTHIQAGVEGYMAGHHQAAQVDVYAVSGATRAHAHALDLSPAKYLAIQALITVDPTASMENCRDHTITEIRQMTQAHTHHQGSQTSDDGTVPDSSSGHHGKGKGNHNGHE